MVSCKTEIMGHKEGDKRNSIMLALIHFSCYFLKASLEILMVL